LRLIFLYAVYKPAPESSENQPFSWRSLISVPFIAKKVSGLRSRTQISRGGKFRERNRRPETYRENAPANKQGQGRYTRSHTKKLSFRTRKIYKKLSFQTRRAVAGNNLHRYCPTFSSLRSTCGWGRMQTTNRWTSLHEVEFSQWIKLNVPYPVKRCYFPAKRQTLPINGRRI
jgi:hypothetical protein